MTPKETRSAVIVFALLLPSLAALFWSGSEAAAVPQLGALRTVGAGGQERAAVFFNGALHLLDARGERLTRQPLGELGLGEEPNDIDFTTGPDGKVQAWMFDDSGPHLVRCELDPVAAMLVQCGRAISGPQLKIHPRSQAVHIAVDAARGRLFVADAKAHAVRALTLKGEVIADGAQGELFFPNRLRIAGDRLVVADNDHRRLAWLDIAADRPGFQVRQTLAVDAHPAASGGRKAADFAIATTPEGQLSALWLLAVAQGQKNGQVLVFGPGLVPGVHADLGGFSDPLVIDRFGDVLLAADFNGSALYRIGADGGFLGTFGAGAFAADLAQARKRLARAELARQGAWAGLALTLVVGLVLAWRFSERPGAQAAREAFGELAAGAEAPAGPAGEPVELHPAASWRRQQLWLNGIALLLMAAAPAATYLLFPEQLPPALKASRLPVLVAALLAVTLPLAFWLQHRAARRWLWVGEGRVEVRMGRQVVAAMPLHRLRASSRTLLVGRELLPYRRAAAGGGAGAWIFDREAMRNHVLAHVPRAQRVSDDALVRAQLMQAPRWQLVVLVAPLLAFAAYAVFRFMR